MQKTTWAKHIKYLHAQMKEQFFEEKYYRWFSISPDNRPGTSMRIKFLHYNKSTRSGVTTSEKTN
jgi:hypothetical protein